MLISSSSIDTAQPVQVIRRLCKHWGHKFPVTATEGRGHIELGFGQCRMQAASGKLEVEVSAADGVALQRLEAVVADHLQRMAHGENLIITWCRVSRPQPYVPAL